MVLSYYALWLVNKTSAAFSANEKQNKTKSSVQIEERSSQLLRNISSCEKPFRTHDLCDAGAVLHQLSYQANWELVIRSSKYMFQTFYLFIHPSRVYCEPTICPAPMLLDSSVGRVLHRHRRGHGFESRSSLNFFQAQFFSQQLKLRSNCEDLFSIWSFSRSYLHLHLFKIIFAELARIFSCLTPVLVAFASSSDWFIALFVSVVIGRLFTLVLV